MPDWISVRLVLRQRKRGGVAGFWLAGSIYRFGNVGKSTRGLVECGGGEGEKPGRFRLRWLMRGLIVGLWIACLVRLDIPKGRGVF